MLSAKCVMLFRRAKTTTERLKTSVEMKESEQVKLLKQQIDDLQSEICTRDARLCAQRTRLNALEKERDRLAVRGMCRFCALTYTIVQKELSDKTTQIDRMLVHQQQLERTNANLRVRTARMSFDAAEAERMREQSGGGVSRPSSAGKLPLNQRKPFCAVNTGVLGRSVHFALPPTTSSGRSRENIGHYDIEPGNESEWKFVCAPCNCTCAVSKGFVRTDNAAVQTSFLSANEQVTNAVAFRQPPLYDSGIAMVSCWFSAQCVRTPCMSTDQLTNVCRRVL
jgi:hypothetical protein